jgi:hypothetical protein
MRNAVATQQQDNAPIAKAGATGTIVAAAAATTESSAVPSSNKSQLSQSKEGEAVPSSKKRHPLNPRKVKLSRQQKKGIH